MLVSVAYVRTDIKTSSFHYTYVLTDKLEGKACPTYFVIPVDTVLSVSDQHAAITNGILEFVYSTYRETHECPFRNIKTMYDYGGLQYGDHVIRSTAFYERHAKVMDKILRPETIVPAEPTTSNNFYYTMNTTAAAYNYSTSATSFTTTINLTYPMQYINLRFEGQ